VIHIEGVNLHATMANNRPVLEMEHTYDDKEIYNSEMIAVLEED